MTKFQIVHNPRCSKSRDALAILKEHGIEPEIIEYLNGGLNRELLLKIIETLNIHPKEMVRTKEEEFQALKIDLNNSQDVIKALLDHPKLLERPIVLKGNKAVIGRPPENVLSLID
ncbi:arsenate reductase (glutaredoxin) [Peredibacter starrii]|uniref:Arsenate reductase (Glutaredoxin) n=1 Tax=Peredibacter starrii TaxID=28202 RepID=A0AAX4HJ82_9BACT|nr:arsenate reductase (glutaredoxin) [Peredibacter starrii]WPU63293.1 arsenate reductase (glutaredoxin) [Peredibacter starrii]